MNWIILFVAGIFEIVWAVSLKLSNGFQNIKASVAFVVGMILSMWFLSLSLRTIPLGTAYAIWTGIGAVGGFIAGIVFFGESASAFRLCSAALIVAGIVGLKLAA